MAKYDDNNNNNNNNNNVNNYSNCIIDYNVYCMLS